MIHKNIENLHTIIYEKNKERLFGHKASITMIKKYGDSTNEIVKYT